MPINEALPKKVYDRLWRKANAKRLAARRRQRYAEDSEYRQKQIDAAKAYRDAHKTDPAYLARTRKKSFLYQRQRRAAKLVKQGGTS